MDYFTIFDQNKPFSYTCISTTTNPIDMIQSPVCFSQLVLNSSYFLRLSHDIFVRLSTYHFIHFFLDGARHEIQISYSCQRCIQNTCILPYIYGNYSLELGEDIEFFVWSKTFAWSLYITNNLLAVGDWSDTYPSSIHVSSCIHIFTYPPIHVSMFPCIEVYMYTPGHRK